VKLPIDNLVVTRSTSQKLLTTRNLRT